MADVPALPHAEEIADARARVEWSRSALSLAPRVGAVVAQLRMLVGTEVPDDALPGDDLFAAVGKPSSTDLAGRRRHFERAAEVLAARAARYATDQAALDQLLALQQKAMFDPACRETIAVLKQLGGEQKEVGQQAGKLRQLLAQLRPLAASLDEDDPVREAALARLADLLDERPEPAELDERVAALSAELEQLEARAGELERQIRALTG